MDILCYLTDWKTSQVTRGRGKGNESTTCWVIALFKWDMAFGQVNKKNTDVLMPGAKSYPNFRLMLPALEYNLGMNQKEVAKHIAVALRKHTGKTCPIDWDALSVEDIATKLEETYNINYFRHDDCRRFVFGGELNEADDSGETE